MTGNERILLLLLVPPLFLYPIMAYYNTYSALLMFSAVFVCAVVFHTKMSVEKYERMDFFPWNEANLVKKRYRDSTVIDCGWDLDQKNNDIFHKNDPVVSEYSNLS